MSTMQNPWGAEIVGNGIAQGVVVRLDTTDVVVGLDGAADEPLVASVLHTNDAATLQLAVGDNVLVWCPAGDSSRGVILGRIGPSNTTPVPNEKEAVPATLLLEAREQLTLRVGDGSITIRADGKILITGVDLVSHAKRMNRIKGGAVAIN